MKSLTITPNDIAVFEVVQEFPCLSLPFIAELLGIKPKERRYGNKVELRYEGFRHRLALLRQSGYLSIRRNLRPRKGQKNRHDVFALTEKSHALLAERHLAKPSIGLTNQADHDVGAAFIVASMKLGVMADPALRWITPQQIVAHEYCPQETRMSDNPFAIPVKYMHRDRYVEMVRSHDWWPFGIQCAGRKILFAGIEYDRNTEGLESANAERPSIERHLRTVLAMLESGYEAHFGTSKFFVLFVFDKVERMRQAMELLQKYTDHKGSKHILFKHMPDWDITQEFPKADGHMLTEPWHRVGYEDFHIVDAFQIKKEAA